MKRIVIINGPNLNLLGERDAGQYGHLTLDEVNGMLLEAAEPLNVRLSFFQSNHEGGLIDLLHQERHSVEGFIVNPGAYTHYSYALRDAIEAVAPPVVEVHLSDIDAREEWRRVSVIREVVLFAVSGKGPQGYVEALERLVEYLEKGV